jgi:hypothetical protein
MGALYLATKLEECPLRLVRPPRNCPTFVLCSNPPHFFCLR